MTSISSDDIDPTIPIDQPISILDCSTIHVKDDYFENTDEVIIIVTEEEDDFIIVNKDKVPPVTTVEPIHKTANKFTNIIETDVVPRLSIARDYCIVGCGLIYYGGVTGAKMLANQSKEMIELSKPFNIWMNSGLKSVKYVFENFDTTCTQVIQKNWI